MNKTNQLVTIIISSFVTAFKNNRLNGLEFNFDFEPMKEVCEFFDAKPVGAYGCFTFELDGKTIFVYSTYGDSDVVEHDEEENEDGMVYGIVSMGFCFYLDQFMYCFDLDECGTIVRFLKQCNLLLALPTCSQVSGHSIITETNNRCLCKVLIKPLIWMSM